MIQEADMSSKPYVGLDFARRPGEKWPRLSLELTELRHPDFCQSCGVYDADSETQLTRWREHDDADRPERILVVLCRSCSDALIEPHPRLYDALDECAPWPGGMPLCAGCRWREGLDCRHPDAKVNGGKGVALTMPEPFVAFVDVRTGPKGGRRFGERVTVYGGPVTACAGREATKGKDDGNFDG